MRAEVSRLSPTKHRELISLQREKDPALRGAGLLALAGRLEESKDFASAARIYAELAKGPTNAAERAQRRLQALQGSGSFGDQAEFALGQVFTGLADPAALTAMGAAGAAYRVVRLAALSRLIAAPAAGLLTRGLGARTLASSLAFAAEGSVFPAVHRLTGRALGQTPAAIGFGEEALASYCALGGLRLAGLAGRGLSRGLPSGLGSGLLRQGTMLGGVLLGSGFERSLGLREAAPWSSTLAQALTTLLHFNAAGALFRGLSGPRFQAWERGVDLRIRNLETGLPAVHAFAGPRLAPAAGGDLIWKMADGEKGGKPLGQGPVSPTPASGQASLVRHEQVLEFIGTLEVTTDLLKRQSPIITALGSGNLRVKIQQGSGGWPSGFLSHLAKSIKYHLARRGLLEDSGQTLTVELHGSGKTHQIVRLNKVAGEYVLANDSQPAPPREPGTSPFMSAANLLKAKPEETAKPAAVAPTPSPAPEHTWQRFERELKTEVNFIRQGRGEGQARLILREKYPADFFERREHEIAKRLHERSGSMIVPLGFKVIFQIGEAEGAREVVFVKALGCFRKDNPKPKL